MATALACAPERERSVVERDEASPATTPDPAPSLAEELETRAAARMAASFTDVGLAPIHSGSTITIGALELEIEAELEHQSADADKHLLVARLSINVDGEPIPAFSAELIGFGPSADAALTGGLDEWYGQHGAPISFALAEIERPEAFHPPRAGTKSADYFIRMLVDGVALYLSPVGLRGAALDPAQLTDEPFTIAIARLAVTHVGPLARYRGVSLKISVEADGVAEIECLVDGREQPALCQALAKRTWPKPAPAYMYSQSFVMLGAKSTRDQLAE